MKPLKDRVLVSIPPEPTDQMDGELYIPSTAAKDQFPTADVVAVGPKVEAIKVGDKVLVDRYSIDGTRVTIDFKPYFLFDEDKILAIMS